jgi:hypothetical protein
MGFPCPSRRRAAVLAAPVLLAGLATGGQAMAQSLEGSWSGGGSVAFATGQHERARCRARYRRTSATSYAVTATCATASGRAAQTATVSRIDGNTYRGRFYNSDYDVSGTIYVTVGGNRQSVRLMSPSGSASLELRR